MTFKRNFTTKWHLDVPGARWLKADLHTHTVDDHPGGKAKMPAGVNGDPTDPQTLSVYARHFLRAAVAGGVQVLGVTPHSPRTASAPETSAVWHIVEEWNSGLDDDGVPFREKIFAVFPGFEPSLKDGKQGLHLLFLFDPEIGRDRYLRLFDALMDGASPWSSKQLRVSSRTAEECFETLHTFSKRESGQDSDRRRVWSCLVLAPHIDSDTGLLGAQKGEVLGLFRHDQIRALELGDEKLPAETVNNRPWLVDGMEKHRQAFFHSSDAYAVADLGRRHVWLKLASPTIEALRQAFIASDSRVRIGFQRAEHGALRAVSKPPDVTLTGRPWLRSVTVRGGASFFGGLGQGGKGETRFELSPDLTCVIGGSMTGKSTFLDGLRSHVEAPLPVDPRLREQVEQRGRQGFLAGSAEVELDCPGRNAIEPLHDRWPAVFYTQSELEQLANEPAAVEDILARLDPAETEEVKGLERRLKTMDGEIRAVVRRLDALAGEEAEAQQAHDRARRAQDELAAFAEAGVERLHGVARQRQQWDEAARVGSDLKDRLAGLLEEVESFELPEIPEDIRMSLDEQSTSLNETASRPERLRVHLRAAATELAHLRTEVEQAAKALRSSEGDLHTEVERALVARGFDASRIREFQTLNRQAALVNSYRATLEEIGRRLQAEQQAFDGLLQQRDHAVMAHRLCLDRIIARIEAEFANSIRARRIDHGEHGPLDAVLRELGQRGITRWWNDLDKESRPSPRTLLDALDQDRLTELGMSPAVQATFREQLTSTKRLQLAALRCPDRYVLEHRMDEEEGRPYRPLDMLSGGRRVSVLLALLLKTADERPLVIDQPEDQLDNSFLFDEVLPALKALKGHRQIIVATHNANIVVNGDADQVIQLEATGSRGRVACSGAIEEPSVRDAIVRTVDGGDDAFRLRRLKYGF
jgi:hypothetical protein